MLLIHVLSSNNSIVKSKKYKITNEENYYKKWPQ